MPVSRDNQELFVATVHRLDRSMATLSDHIDWTKILCSTIKVSESSGDEPSPLKVIQNKGFKRRLGFISGTNNFRSAKHTMTYAILSWEKKLWIRKSLFF